MLLNVLQYTRQLPQQRIIWSRISVGPRLRNPVLCKHIVSAACYVYIKLQYVDYSHSTCRSPHHFLFRCLQSFAIANICTTGSFIFHLLALESRVRSKDKLMEAAWMNQRVH